MSYDHPNEDQILIKRNLCRSERYLKRYKMKKYSNRFRHKCISRDLSILGIVLPLKIYNKRLEIYSN